MTEETEKPFEEALKDLESSVQKLEAGELKLEEALSIFENGIVASIHTDMFGRDHKKELEIKGEKGNIYWNSGDNKVTHYCSEKKITSVYQKFSSDFV